MLSGKWTYRSYRSETGLVAGDAAAALALIFGEGVFDFQREDETHFRGALGMGTGYALTLAAILFPAPEGKPVEVAIVGKGMDGTPTAGWRYDYRAVFGYVWPEGVGQVPSLVGTVVRVNAHGPSAPAGYTASFIAVKHPASPPPRTARRSSLTAGL
jgi:hypothetical protein